MIPATTTGVLGIEISQTWAMWLPIAAAVITNLFVHAIKPWIEVECPTRLQRALAGKRVLLLVWLLSVGFSALIEDSTITFQNKFFIRNALLTAGVAVLLHEHRFVERTAWLFSKVFDRVVRKWLGRIFNLTEQEVEHDTRGRDE